MYEGWKFERWETPISDLRSAGMVSLIDDGRLRITIQDLRDPARNRWCFTFERAPIYRNILEEYRLELWHHISREGRKGWTLVIPESPWLKEIKQNESLMDVLSPGLEHYLVATEDDVIDILSDAPPLIEKAPPGDTNPSNVGKSRILHADRDRSEIDAIIDAIKSGSDDP